MVQSSRPRISQRKVAPLTASSLPPRGTPPESKHPSHQNGTIALTSVGLGPTRNPVEGSPDSGIKHLFPPWWGSKPWRSGAESLSRQPWEAIHKTSLCPETLAAGLRRLGRGGWPPRKSKAFHRKLIGTASCGSQKKKDGWEAAPFSTSLISGRVACERGPAEFGNFRCTRQQGQRPTLG